MRLNRFTFSDALREKQRSDRKWLLYFVALFIFVLCILFASLAANAEPLPDAPVAKHSHWKPDTGWLTWAHLTAATYDGATTLRSFHEYHDVYAWHEADPLSRILIGDGSSAGRMALFGGLEVYGVALLPRKYRIPVQLGLIAVHLVEGSRNLRPLYRFPNGTNHP